MSGPPPAVRPLDVRDPRVAAELLPLQRRSYRIEAELIGSDAIPPLHESLAELMACGEQFLGAFHGEVLVGAISYRIEGDTLDIHRLVVDPSAFRRGIGRELVRAVQELETAPTHVVVQTGAANGPATTLYRQEGFAALDVFEPIPGLAIARFEKHRAQRG